MRLYVFVDPPLLVFQIIYLQTLRRQLEDISIVEPYFLFFATFNEEMRDKGFYNFYFLLKFIWPGMPGT